MRKSRVVMSVLAAGAAGALAVGIPAWTSSGSSSTTAAASAACSTTDMHQALRKAAADNPDIKAALTKLKSVPKEQRASTLRDFAKSHPDVKNELQALRDKAQACKATA